MRLPLVLGLSMAFLINTAYGQTNALAPEGWTDLETWAHGAGLIINAQRMCGIEYDPEKLQQHFALLAGVAGVSADRFDQAALEAANRQAPHVTRDTCETAKKIARRNGMLR